MRNWDVGMLAMQWLMYTPSAAGAAISHVAAKQ